MRPNWISKVIIAAVVLSGFQAYAQDVKHGRVSYVDNDGLIRGTEDDEWSVAQLNSLVMPGDTIWADEDGVLEVEVSGGSFVRMADSSKIEITSMPPITRIKGWSGSFYVQRLRQSEGDFVFETPVGDIRIENDSQVRIDVLDEGATTITVRWGSAVIHSGSGTLRVGSGKRVYIDPGYLPSTAEAFDRAQEDSFDTWNRERARQIAKGAERVNIGTAGSYSTPIGAYDLNDYGDWIVVDNQQYWQPTVVREYVPYRTGSWSYVPSHGHTWVGHHPFTYITSHHGYWSHHHHHGWIWSYNHAYSPAYVASVRYNDVFIWAPLSIHGDAVYQSGGYFTAGGFHFSIGYSSYAYSHHLLGGHAYSYSAHHYHHVSHHHHYNAYHWNIYSSGSHHYEHRPHRNPHHRVRDYTPQRVMRGPGSVRRDDRTYEARNRVAALESRVSRSQFNSLRDPSTRTSRVSRTPINSTSRNARARNVSFEVDPAQRIATRSARLRALPGDGTVAPRSHIREAGTPEVRTAKRVPSSTTRFTTINPSPTENGNSRSVRSTTISRGGTTEPRGGTESGRSNSTRVTSRSERPAPNANLNRRATTTPSSRTSGTLNRREQAPSANSTNRVRTQTPQQSASARTVRPQATQIRQGTPKSYNGRDVTPQVSAPRSSTRQTIRLPKSTPRVSAPRQSAPIRSAPRVSSPQPVRPQVSQPRQSAPQPQRSVSAPRTVTRSAPQVSAPRSSGSRSSAPSSSSRSSSGSSSRGSRGPR